MNQQKDLFENYASGDERIQGKYMKSPPNAEDTKKADHTNKMLMLALDLADCGPSMDKLYPHTEAGTTAFLRAIRNFYPEMRQDFSDTTASILPDFEIEMQELIRDAAKNPEIGLLCSQMKSMKEKEEQKSLIAKPDVTPIVLFLHGDQGIAKHPMNPYYSAMGSPRANVRSIDSTHVMELCEAQRKLKTSILSIDDFTVAPYWHETLTDDGEEGISYRCILNRDKFGKNGVFFYRTALCLTKKRIAHCFTEVRRNFCKLRKNPKQVPSLTPTCSSLSFLDFQCQKTVYVRQV